MMDMYVDTIHTSREDLGPVPESRIQEPSVPKAGECEWETSRAYDDDEMIPC